MDVELAPAAKKRKLAATGSFGPQIAQSSFADVLERLKEESGSAGAGKFLQTRWFLDLSNSMTCP